jgi:drug/metabolite transporter (DMT)-like permease
MALALTIFALWGANNLAIKVAVEAIPPLAAAGLRFGLAIGILALWGRSRGVGIRLQPGELKLLAGLSALFLIQIGALNVAQKLTSAVRGTVFLASHPLFIGLFASLLIPGDKLTRQRLVGLLLAFAGVFVTFAEGFFQPGAYLWGDALMMVSAVLLGLRLIVLKLILQRTPVARTLFWQATLSVPVFFGLSLLFERHAWGHVAARHVGAMLYQGVVIAGFCFAGNAWLYENFRASQIAAFTFSVPLWGVLICGLVAHDPITVWLVAGVALVATGIAVANRSSGAEPADEEEPPVLEPAEP